MKQKTGWRSALTFVCLFFFIIACSKKNIMASDNNKIDSGTTNLKYLALGDSYTIGQNVQANERFPFLTVSLLNQQKFTFSEPRYIATTGWTTANLITAINNQVNLGTFDIVTLLIGVNDQYQHIDTATYRSHFTQLLKKSIELAGNRPSHVFVLSIPDYSATPFVGANDKERVHKEIDNFNAINREITLQNNIAYIDITPLTREAATDASLLADDGLHYSAKEHQKWADLLAPKILEALK